MELGSQPFWSQSVAITATPSVLYLPSNVSEVMVHFDVAGLVAVGNTYAAPAVSSTNAITTISSSGTPTGGVFYVVVADAGTDRSLTTALTFDDSAADLKAALIAISPAVFATGDITAAGGALPTAITLTWTGVYAATAPLLTIVSEVTGGSNSKISARTTTQPIGNGGYGFVAAGMALAFDVNKDKRGDKPNRFLYLATLTGSGTVKVSAYRSV